jgi:hypothetical protein
MFVYYINEMELKNCSHIEIQFTTRKINTWQILDHLILGEVYNGSITYAAYSGDFCGN